MQIHSVFLQRDARSAIARYCYHRSPVGPSVCLSVCLSLSVCDFDVACSGGARILEQVGPAAGPKVVW